MKLAALSNWDINKYYMKNIYYGGCYSRDLLKKIPRDMAKSRKFYVVNIDPFDSGRGGTHWIAISNLDNDLSIVFDPFGVEELPPDVLEWLKSNRKVVYVNTHSVQDISKESCGYFCLFVLDHLLKGYKFTEVLAMFSPNRLENEKILKRYFYPNN